MKTIFHATIDGHEIVLGFGDPHIAPVETYAVIEPLVRELPEHAAMAAKVQEIARARAHAREALHAASTAQRRGQRAEAERANAEYRSRVLDLEVMERDLPPLVQAFDAAKAKLIVEHAVYFHPRQGEDLIDDEPAAALVQAFAEHRDGYALKLDGTLVPDLRGRTYYRQVKGVWEIQHITALGLEPLADAIAEASLTDAQRAEIAEQAESERVQALSDEERQAEAERAQAAALTQAAAMRSKLEIAGDKGALAKSQAWYAEEQARIAERYGE